jgi:hypothetical protein
MASYIVQVDHSQCAVTVHAMDTYCFHPQGIMFNVRPKYMVMFQDQYVRHNDSRNRRNKSCDKVEQFKNLGTTWAWIAQSV